MQTDLKWYAVYTRPRWEKKVATLLTQKNIENYCPLNKVHRQWKDRKKIVFEPIFKSYVFVYTSVEKHLSVKQTDGVFNFVYWLGSPAVIKDKEIDLIKNFLSDHRNVKILSTEINLNDRVRISGGPFTLEEGSVVEIKRKTVKVFLPSLKIALYAEVDKSNVEKV